MWRMQRTWQEAGHDEKGYGGRCVALEAGGCLHCLLPSGCILLWEGLLQNVMQRSCDIQLPARMQHLCA